MSDKDPEEVKPKGVDFSTISFEAPDEECSAPADKTQEEVHETAGDPDATGDASLKHTGTSALQGAAGSTNALQDAIKASGIGTAQDSLRDAFDSFLDSGIHNSPLLQRNAAELGNIDTTALERAQAQFDALPSDYIDSLRNAQSALAETGLQERLQELTKQSSFSHIAAGIQEQQSLIDEMQQDRLEASPALQNIHIPENPIVETNRRLARIEQQFDQVFSIATRSAQTAADLQLAAAEFLKEFKDAASKNDKAASDAIQLGKYAIWAAVIIPILVFGATIAANFVMPNHEAEAMQQLVIGLQLEVEALQETSINDTQRIIDALMESDQSTTTAILEGMRGLQMPTDSVAPSDN